MSARSFCIMVMSCQARIPNLVISSTSFDAYGISSFFAPLLALSVSLVCCPLPPITTKKTHKYPRIVLSMVCSRLDGWIDVQNRLVSLLANIRQHFEPLVTLKDSEKKCFYQKKSFNVISWILCYHDPRCT